MVTRQKKRKSCKRNIRKKTNVCKSRNKRRNKRRNKSRKTKRRNKRRNKSRKTKRRNKRRNKSRKTKRGKSKFKMDSIIQQYDFNFKKLSIKDLKNELKILNVSSNGSKSVLINRLNDVAISKMNSLEYSEFIDEIIKSWVLMGLRSTIELTEVRNNILMDIIGIENIQKYSIHLGKTLQDVHYKVVIDYVKDILNDNSANIYLFTASNQPSLTTAETHFQTFILIKDMKMLFCIDPSAYNSRQNAEGFYNTDMTNKITEYFDNINFEKVFDDKLWDIIKNPVGNTPQTQEGDVFCQTWSLFLQIEYIIIILKSTVNLNIVLNKVFINIPFYYKDKYQVLNAFYKRYLHVYCNQLQTEYQKWINSMTFDDSINESWDSIIDLYIIRKLMNDQSKNMCNIINQMTHIDFLNEHFIIKINDYFKLEDMLTHPQELINFRNFYYICEYNDETHILRYSKQYDYMFSIFGFLFEEIDSNRNKIQDVCISNEEYFDEISSIYGNSNFETFHNSLGFILTKNTRETFAIDLIEVKEFIDSGMNGTILYDSNLSVTFV